MEWKRWRFWPDSGLSEKCLGKLLSTEEEEKKLVKQIHGREAEMCRENAGVFEENQGELEEMKDLCGFLSGTGRRRGRQEGL